MKAKMSEHGATLQTYNQELVKCLEDLKLKRKEILDILNKEEIERNAIEKNMQILGAKLDTVNNNIKKHRNLYDSYEKTIQDTEKGFKKILESSQILLSLAQVEANKLDSNYKNPATSKLTVNSADHYPYGEGV